MATREEFRSEGIFSSEDENFNDFDSPQVALPYLQAFTEPRTSETQVGIWREEGLRDSERIEGEAGGHEEEVEHLGGLRPTNPKENASSEEGMALVTAVKARNPLGAPQGKQVAY